MQHVSFAQADSTIPPSYGTPRYSQRPSFQAAMHNETSQYAAPLSYRPVNTGYSMQSPSVAPYESLHQNTLYNSGHSMPAQSHFPTSYPYAGQTMASMGRTQMNALTHSPLAPAREYGSVIPQSIAGMYSNLPPNLVAEAQGLQHGGLPNTQAPGLAKDAVDAPHNGPRMYMYGQPRYGLVSTSLHCRLISSLN